MGSSNLSFTMIILKFLLIYLSVKNTYSLRCLGCTSDNGNNMACEEPENANPDDLNFIECPEEKDYCYVMVQNLKTSGNILVWNRSCCQKKDDANDCPANQPNHQENEFFEIWRKYCKEDDCNTNDPRETSDEGGGIVIVDGRAGANSIITPGYNVMLPAVVLLAVFNMRV